MSVAELLERHPLFHRMSLDHIERIAQAGQLEEFAPGEEIVREGSLGDALYLVLTGGVQVVKNNQSLAQLAAGEFFGEMALIEPAPRSASVIAAEPTYLFRLPYLALQALLEEDAVAFNSVLVHIVRTLSERLRRANEMITSVGQLADWLAGSLV